LMTETSDGERRTRRLEPRTVADFYRDVMATLREMSLPVKIWTMPVEVPHPIPFEQDTVHHSFDPDYASRVWRIMLQAERIFAGCRSKFLGKCSPVHFFWGGFDLALTRFSGPPPPPREGPAFLRAA